MNIWGISATDAQTVYDYGFDTSYYGKGAVVRPWNRLNPLLAGSNLASSTSSSHLRPGFSPSFVLPTDEIHRMSFLLPPMLQSGRPILLVGPRGSGKSTIVSHVVHLLSAKGYHITAEHMTSSLTNSPDITNSQYICRISLQQAPWRIFWKVLPILNRHTNNYMQLAWKKN
jgi:hypothetical protein